MRANLRKVHEKPTYYKPKRDCGFTLVEMIITITLAGIIAVGIVQVSGKMVSQSANPMLRYQAIAIAEAYLNEILAKNFEPLSSCTAATDRSQFKSICQYNGLNDSVAAGGAKDQNNTAIAGLAAYAVTVNVTESDKLGDITDATATQLITVSVDGPADLDASLSAYRSNF